MTPENYDRLVMFDDDFPSYIIEEVSEAHRLINEITRLAKITRGRILDPRVRLWLFRKKTDALYFHACIRLLGSPDNNDFPLIFEWHYEKAKAILFQLTVKEDPRLGQLLMWLGSLKMGYDYLDLKEFDPEEEEREEESEEVIEDDQQAPLRKYRKERKKVSKSVRYDILHRDQFQCVLCGTSGKEDVLHVDHIIPVSKGGKSTKDNLRTLCRTCNLGKGDKIEGRSPNE